MVLRAILFQTNAYLYATNLIPTYEREMWKLNEPQIFLFLHYESALKANTTFTDPLKSAKPYETALRTIEFVQVAGS